MTRYELKDMVLQPIFLLEVPMLRLLRLLALEALSEEPLQTAR